MTPINLFVRQRCYAYAIAAVAFTLTASTGLVVRAADWPQWQGPDRNAISKEKGLLQEWPKEGPPLAWKITGLGGGDSAPAIAAGRLYGMSAKSGEEVVWALSEKDGSTIWTKPLGAAVQQGMPQSKEGPGCTPTVDGDRLYVLGMGGELACLQTSDGKILWQKNLTKDFDGRVPMWSYRESPLIDGDKLICTPGGEEAMLAALNKMTGETIWKSKLPAVPAGAAPPEAGRGGRGGRGGGRGGRGFGGGGAAYSSCIVFDFEGVRQYAQFTAKALVGVAAADGKFLWRYDAPAGNGINCSTPIYHNGFVFASSAYNSGGGVVKLSKDEGGGIKAEEVFFSNRMQNHHGGVILHEGALYGANGGNGPGGLITCLDFKTGDVLWTDRKAPKGSVVFADGRIYYRVENGTLLLIEPSQKEFLERGRFPQPERTNSPAWAHPVVANGKLYVRDQDLLLCYDIKAK